MAKHDTARIAGTAEPIPDGETAEPLCDDQAVPYVRIKGTSPDGPPLGGWTEHNSITVPAEPSAATQLPSAECSEIKLIADPANTQPIYVGGSAVSSAKSQDLNAREIEIVRRVSNANEFHVIAAATHTGQKLRYQTR